jgi:uncharacterized phage protein (TIGR02220 family)
MIFHTVKNQKYQCLNNEIFTYNISEGARCLLGYMLTKPADWRFYNGAICNEFHISTRRLAKYLRELKGYGLVYRLVEVAKIKTKDQWVTFVFESPEMVGSTITELLDSKLYIDPLKSIPKSDDTKMTPSKVIGSKGDVSQMAGCLLNTDSLLNTDLLNTDDIYIRPHKIKRLKPKFSEKQISDAKEIVKYWNLKQNQKLKENHHEKIINNFIISGYSLEEIKEAIDNMLLGALSWMAEKSLITLFRQSNSSGACDYIADCRNYKFRTQSQQVSSKVIPSTDKLDLYKQIELERQTAMVERVNKARESKLNFNKF